ncbi:uncharacterized protein LOC135834738 [Planococcus citri]|uniref:uncharacterized protein LOC135834738 n=1 Tax=Planococcus citri TaxID=170843 RepID=UPI0031F9F5A1
MDDDMDLMGLLRGLQQENAKKKLLTRDIAQIIVQWYLKMMGFIKVDDDKFKRRAFGLNTPFEFTSRTDKHSFELTRLPHPDDNAYRADVASSSSYYGFGAFLSLNLDQSSVEKDAKKLRVEMKRLHSSLRRAWENILD